MEQAKKTESRKIIKIVAYSLLAAIVVVLIGTWIYFYSCDHAGNQVYDYENKELWYNPLGIAKGTLSMNIRVSGAKSLGWKFGDYINSPTGEWIINQYRFVQQGYKEDDPEIFAYWESLGMKKEIFHADSKEEKYFVFTPIDHDEEALPVMFVMHGGMLTPYMAEWYGFVEEGAERGYMVVIPEWAASLSSAQEAEVRDSGLGSYEAFAVKKVIDELLENHYPMDTTRMYIAGISGGGNAAAYAAKGLPEYFSAFSPATGAAIQGNGIAGAGSDSPLYEQLSGIREYGGMGMMMNYGLWDQELRWPISSISIEGGSKAVFRTVEERIENINQWLTSCGAKTDGATVESVNALAALNDGSASSCFGIDFDSNYEKEYEVRYCFGDLYNDDGDVVVRFMGVEKGPHWVSPMWASEFYDFCEHFSRDAETHMLIVE